MHHVIPFFTGFFASVLGTLLPGILNATVVRISKEEGMKHAYSFMAGTFVIIALQTYLAVFFAKVIENSIVVTNILREIGFVAFFILTLYFFIAKPKSKFKSKFSVQAKRKSFYQGLCFALLNIFPVFYYVFISITAINNDWYAINYVNNILLTVGVLLGTFSVFMFYINLFKQANIQDNFFLKNINKIIGTITAVIAIVNLYKLVR